VGARAAPGIEVRHGKSCPAHRGGRCAKRGCGYRAEVWSRRDRKRIRRTFRSLAAAKAWRSDALAEVRRGQLRAGRGVTLGQAAAEWLAAAEGGAVTNRSGDRYKPSALRGYRTSLEKRILPALGRSRLSEVDRRTIQRLVAQLIAEGHDPSTVRNTIVPLRAIFRYAVAHGDVSVNPTTGLHLPAVRSKRDHIVSPADAHALLAALGPQDRPLWATALFTGLRRGELMALRWRDVDFERGLIRVERSWDVKAGPVLPKSRAGRRVVPLPKALRPYLKWQAKRSRGASYDALVFGRTETVPFDPGTIRKRANRAWNTAGLVGLGLHECRHTYASMMIAAGANLKALSTYLGHSSITITMDRYGHLMPGNESEAAELFDRYLARGAVMGQSCSASSGVDRPQPVLSR
jgi:integrase